MKNGMKVVLGIESTAHTLGVGIAEGNGVSGRISLAASVVEKVPHTKKGFIPRLLAEHHSKAFEKAVAYALTQAEALPGELDAVAFSQGPGMGHSLRVGFVGAKALAGFLGIPLLPVNHCVAHCEVGKWECGFEDPLVLYVSGGNTQILVLEDKHYRVLGETLDIGVGNFLDVLAREFGLNNAVEVMQHAGKGRKLLELPYTIKGMNVSFTGLLTYCIRNYKSKVETGEVSLDDVCFSAQETVFAILTEAAERALHHYSRAKGEKKELLACGGVACNKRLQEMLRKMCAENKVKFGVPRDEFNRDNGFMISLVGLKMLEAGGKIPFASGRGPIQKMRPEMQEISWLERGGKGLNSP